MAESRLVGAGGQSVGGGGLTPKGQEGNGEGDGNILYVDHGAVYLIVCICIHLLFFCLGEVVN